MRKNEFESPVRLKESTGGYSKDLDDQENRSFQSYKASS